MSREGRHVANVPEPGRWARSLFLWPWERPADPVRWRTIDENGKAVIGVALLVVAGVALSVQQLVAGPRVAWLWAAPLLLVSLAIGWYLLAALATWGRRPQRGTPEAMTARERGRHRYLALRRTLRRDV